MKQYLPQILTLYLSILMGCTVSRAQTALQLPAPADPYLQLWRPAYVNAVNTLLQQMHPSYKDSSLHLINQALQLSQQMNQWEDYGKITFEKGNIYRIHRENEKAKLAYFMAMSYIRKCKDQTFLSRIYTNLGLVYWQTAQVDSAIFCYFKALDLFKELRSTDTLQLMSIYTNLGGNLGYEKLTVQALYYLNKSLTLAKAQNNEMVMAYNYQGMGANYDHLQQYDSAQFYLQQSLSYYKKTDNASQVVNLWLFLGWVAIRSGDLRKAQLYCDSALNHAPYLAQSAIGLQINQGNIAMKKGNYKQAISFFRKGLLKTRERNVVNSRSIIHRDLATCYYKSGNPTAAYEALAFYSDLRDSLLSEKQIALVNQMELRYHTAASEEKLANKELELVKISNAVQTRNLMILALSSLGVAICGFLFSLYRSAKHKEKLEAEKLLTFQQASQIQLLHARMEGAEKERARIAQDLHDGIGGLIAAVKMNFSILQQRHSALSKDKGYRDTLNLLSNTAGEVRKTAHNLMPADLSNQGLDKALAQYCLQLNRSQMETKFVMETYALNSILPPELKRTVFLVVQELLQNVLKHAHANRAFIQLSEQDSQLQVIVDDNGVGLSPRPEGTGMGLKNLKERMELLSGTCIIDSEQGKGTTIILQFDILQLKAIPSSNSVTKPDSI